MLVFRFYFKKVSDEFDCGVVFEEVRDDDAILPIFEEKIVGKVEKVDWNFGNMKTNQMARKRGRKHSGGIEIHLPENEQREVERRKE